MAVLTEAYNNLRNVNGDDGNPLVETKGVDQRECTAWRETLTQIDELWSAMHRRANGVNAGIRRAVEDEAAAGNDSVADITDEWEFEDDETASQASE